MAAIVFRASRPGCKKGWIGGLLALGVLGVGVGCDQEAAQRNAAARSLSSAIAAMQEADAAVPAEDQSFADARLSALESAVAPLEEAAAKGTPAQKTEAKKLLARIDAQVAEHLARQAGDNFATLRVRMTNLLGKLDTAEALGATAQLADRDPAAAITLLDEEAAKERADQETLATRIGELQGQADALEAQIARHRQDARVAFADKSELDAAAFVQEGDEKFETLERAADAQARADAAEVAVRRVQIDLRRAQDQLVLARKDAETTEAALKQFAETKAGFESAGQDARSTVRQLRDQQRQTAAAVVETVEELAAAYAERVQAPLRGAADRAASAVDHLQSAGSGSGVGEERLDKQLVHAQVLANAAGYASSLRASIEAVANRAAFADAPELRQRLAAAAVPLNDAATAAQQAATEAIAAAQRDLGEPDPEDALATTVRDALARLAEQVGAPTNAPPAPEAG